MSTFTLPFDPTGLSPVNRITLPEVHTLEPSAFTPSSYFIVPRLAPFFTNNFSIVDHFTGRVLQLGVDYYFTHRFVDAANKLDADLYGSISFYQIPSMPTAVRLVSYQSIGGMWTLDTAGLLEFLANTEYNPRIALWEQVVDLPETFPVHPHGHNAETDTGSYFAMIAALGSIAEAVRYLSGETLPTLEQLGIGNILNYPLAEVSDLADGGTVETYVNANLLVMAITMAIESLSIPELGISNTQAYPGNLGEANRLTAEANSLAIQQNAILTNAHQSALTIVNYSVPYFADASKGETDTGLPNNMLAIRSAPAPSTAPIRTVIGEIFAETSGANPKALVTVEWFAAQIQQLMDTGELPIVAIQNLQQEMLIAQSTLEDQVEVNGQVGDALQENALDIIALTSALNLLTQRISVLEMAPTASRQALGNISGATTVNLAVGSHVRATATGNVTFTFTLPPSFDPATETFIAQLLLTMNAAYTITPPTGTIFPNGTAPQLLGGKTYLISFVKSGTENWRMSEPTVWNS